MAQEFERERNEGLAVIRIRIAIMNDFSSGSGNRMVMLPSGAT
jgi:hypothetical protein